jgi:putative restriction endonuclease
MESSVRGFVAVTDISWLGFLQTLGQSDEINFWRPTATASNHAVGTPWFFKAKSPVNAIVGGGFFSHYTELPVSMAWQTFQEKNGVPSLAALLASLSHIRSAPNKNGLGGPALTLDTTIGCVILSSPWFLPPDSYIRTPGDFHINTVVGKWYDLTGGPGRELWDAMSTRTAPPKAELLRKAATPGGWGEPRLVRTRLGQGSFRFSVLDAYGRACAVTGDRVLPALEAAHIQPFSASQSHEVSNGIALRADLHRLFDLGYVGVDSGGVFRVSTSLRDQFGAVHSYRELEGKHIGLPVDETNHPDPESLGWHYSKVYRGS